MRVKSSIPLSQHWGESVSCFECREILVVPSLPGRTLSTPRVGERGGETLPDHTAYYVFGKPFTRSFKDVVLTVIGSHWRFLISRGNILKTVFCDLTMTYRIDSWKSWVTGQ